MVSILVVLDHWFGRSCFGLWARRHSEVSILVVLDHWFGRRPIEPSYTRAVGFQSLLFWIIGSGLQIAWLKGTADIGFNPCCFGSLVRADHQRRHRDLWRCFNPCCFGSLVRAATKLIAPSSFVSFNPCCFGSLVRAFYADSARSIETVSILVVLDHWFGHPSRIHWHVDLVVSILVVLDHWFGRPHGRTKY